MSIIVEDGTGSNPLANSYTDEGWAREFATSRGLVLPCDNDTLSKLLLRAMDYLESFAEQYAGCKTSSLQPLQHPRTGVYLYGSLIAPNYMPELLKRAQVHTAVAIHAGFDPLQTVGNTPRVIEEQIDVIRVKYDTSTPSGNNLPQLTAVMSCLTPLFGSSGYPTIFQRV